MGFLSDLFGGSARKDLRRSKAASDAALDSGYADASGMYDQAGAMYDPYAQRGEQGSATYSQAIGLGTPEEQAAAQQRYFNDPAMQQVLGQQSNALLRRYNSQGSGTGGGRLALAGTRVGLENYGGWLDRVKGVGDQGLAATGAKSNVLLGKGDMRFGLGATKAGSEINFGNAMSQSRSTGINNLLNIAGTAAKVYAASDIRLKRDIKRVGELSYGLPVYSFKYLNSDAEHIGVMAQETLAYKPEAVAIMANGYLCVDYAAL